MNNVEMIENNFIMDTDWMAHGVKSEDESVPYEDLQNEYKYLFAGPDSPIMTKLIKMQQVHHNDLIINMYDENVQSYIEFLELIAKIVRDIGLPNNSISYSKIVSRLIHEGYLSNRSVFVPTTDKTKFLDIIGFLGIDVINGYGCCRHTADIHQDIFRELNLCGDRVYCLSESSITLSQAFNSRGNHIVNLLIYDEMCYVHDILHQKFYYFKNGFTMEEYQGRDTLYYKPSLDIVFNGMSYLDMLKRIRTFHESSAKSYMSARELNEILAETDNQYNNSRQILEDFRREAKSYIKKIVSVKNGME